MTFAGLLLLAVAIYGGVAAANVYIENAGDWSAVSGPSGPKDFALPMWLRFSMWVSTGLFGAVFFALAVIALIRGPHKTATHQSEVGA